jgi:hypothetical protein
MAASASICHLFAWNPLTFALTPFTLKPDKPCLSSKSFTVASLRYGMATSQSGAPKGGAFSPAGQDSLKRTKACTRPNTPAMPLKPEWSPQRAKRSSLKAKEAFNEQKSP